MPPAPPENTVFSKLKYKVFRIYFFPRFFHFNMKIITLWENMAGQHPVSPYRKDPKE